MQISRVSDRAQAESLDLTSRQTDREAALQSALERIAPSSRAASPDSRVTAIERLPATVAEFVAFPEELDSRLRATLTARGVSRLYSHQAEAITHALAGRNVVVTTPTASGKTLCYNAPVLNTILQDPAARALYLFPTKALAQDQLAELTTIKDEFARATDVALGVFTYDGDTPQDARRAIRTRAHIVLSNPDMVHAGILPHHPRWAKLFESLRFVILDELHAYRGVFGSHLANVVRRLQRVCRHYGSHPTFICSSATIANPRELAERLIGEPFALVDRSGAPRGEKLFLFVNPPVVNQQLGIRRSYLTESRRIASEFIKRHLQLIVFAQSRLATEILTTYLKDEFAGVPGAPETIRGYRGGYLPNRRREIEKGLRDGEVQAVVSTNALELGIDIGALDVAVLAGYPGTIAATWQRAGRAGRRSARSAAILVASSAPLDQFIIRHPSYFFDASPEHALINPDNLHILLDHVKCAAFELPFKTSETFGGIDVQQILAILSEEGFVHLSGGSGPDADGRWHWTSESYPADAVSLRSISSDNFVVVDTTDGARVIGETDFGSGPSTLHPKAIYIVEAQLYQVERLDFDNRKAYVRAINCDYYTDAITYTRVTILDIFANGARTLPERSEDGPEREWEDREEPSVDGPTTAVSDPARSHGEVHVVSRVVGFKKIKFYTNENVGSGELDLPEQQMHTTAYWLTIPTAVMSALPHSADDRRDGVVGLSFAMRQVAQLLLMCDRNDIGISVGPGDGSKPADPSGRERSRTPDFDLDEPQIFIYDNYPGGIGFSEPLFDMHASLLAHTRDLIEGCPCDSGCPTCVGPVGDIGPRAKTVALDILGRLASGGTRHSVNLGASASHE